MKGREFGRLLGVIGLLGAVMWTNSSAEAGSGTSPIHNPSLAPGLVTGSPDVELLAQTPWIEKHGVFRLRLRLTVAHPATDELQVLAYDRLTTRTDFNNAASGQLNTFAWYKGGPIKVSTLPADPSGGVDVDIPVNQEPATPAGFSRFDASAGSAIFPIQIGVFDRNGQAQGTPLTTFLVWAAGPEAETNLPPLSVAVIIPFHSAPAVGLDGRLGPLPASESLRLSGLASALAAHPNVKITVEATPQTVDALTGGSAADQATAANLSSALQVGSEQVLPSTYARVSVEDMQVSGLAGELEQQFQAGSSVLARLAGRVPSIRTWALGRQVDLPTLLTLAGAGATQFIMPDSDLSALPPSSTQITFAYPTSLNGAGGPPLTVYAEDPGLSSDFESPAPPVLAANRLLAELAMIQLETPGYTRGVVAAAPDTWAGDPTFVSTLLSGLAGNPLLSPVTASGLFSHVQTAPLSRSLAVAPSASPSAAAAPTSSTSFTTASSAPETSVGSVPVPVSSLEDVADKIRSERQRIAALEKFAPSERTAPATLATALLSAESIDLTDSQRLALLASIDSTISKVFDQVSLPGRSSITLTSTRGQIPLTILSRAPFRIAVRLQLSSQRLIFRPFQPAGGKCVIPTATSETCDLTLDGQNTTLKVPVETRSSGVFPLDVYLYSPDGSQQLAHDKDTVRSTAVSGVGVVLIIVAVVSLAIWWVRDLRHGRRARRLMPVPGEQPDPLVDEFFASPPPEYGSRPKSSS